MIIAIESIVTFETVARLQRSLFLSMASLKPGDELTLDFNQVNAVNSAALALMIELLRRASQLGILLKFINIPPKLMSLAKVSAVDQLLGLP
jgi:ABC-type transporter Mla MlaB component